MHRILIMEPIRTRTDFFNALGRTHGCVDCGPRSLEDLANFLRKNEVSTIVAANMEMELDDFVAIAAVVHDEGVRLAR